LAPMSSSAPSRSESELSPTERQQLEKAHAELRSAVEAYELFVGREIRPGQSLPTVREAELLAAQERVEAAETNLWDLRERLMGWARPPWAPPATSVSDWILEEDPGYDDPAAAPQ
jgi:hypothetical protein